MSKSLCTLNFSYEKFSYNVDFSSRPALRSDLLSIVKALPVTMAVCVRAGRLTRLILKIYINHCAGFNFFYFLIAQIGKESFFSKAKSYAKSGVCFVHIAEAVRTLVSYSVSMPCAEHF